MYRNLRTTFLIIMLILWGPVWAQPTYSSDIQTNYGASYIIPSAGGINMAVNVWGHVQKPGQYLVPYSVNIDILSLLSQAGGPLDGARLDNIILLREDIETSGSHKIIVDLEKFIETGDRSLLPTIGPNDTIIIEPTLWHRFTRNTSLLQTVNTLAVIYFYITR